MIRRSVVLALVALGVFAAPSGAALCEEVQIVASGLQTPWEVAPAPDGSRVFVTELPVGVRVVEDGVLRAAPAYVEAGVSVRKYLGFALDPGFASNGLAYLYETYDTGPTSQSRVVRLKDDGTSFALDGVILDGIGSDRSHDGGRIAFGPDGRLYVTTGDIHDPSTPQDLDSLNGKILRLNPDGTAPDDNPFENDDAVVDNRDFVWSYGHRHPQGIAWDAQGRMWETEHGPSGEAHAPAGATQGRDELNLIEPGGNYGWPLIAGDQTDPDPTTDPELRSPVVHSGPPPAWAPGDLAFSPADGLLYAPGLLGRHIHVFVPDGAGGIASHGRLFDGLFGRLRAGVVDGGALWFTNDQRGVFGEDVFRVAIAASGDPLAPVDCVSDPPAPPSQAPAQPAAAPLAAPSPPPVAAAAPPTSGEPASRADGLERLLARARAQLRRLGLRRLLRRGRLAVRVGGVPGGTVRVRVVLARGSRRAMTVAHGSARPRGRRAFTVRARLTKRGRRVLRRRTRVRLHVLVTHTAPGEPRLERSLRVVARR